MAKDVKEETTVKIVKKREIFQETKEGKRSNSDNVHRGGSRSIRSSGGRDNLIVKQEQQVTFVW